MTFNYNLQAKHKRKNRQSYDNEIILCLSSLEKFGELQNLQRMTIMFPEI